MRNETIELERCVKGSAGAAQYVAMAIHNVANLPAAEAAFVAHGATPVLAALAAQPAVTASPAAAEWVGKALAWLQ